MSISPWEIITAPGALRALDKDHDGKLSAEECGFFMGAGSNVPKELMQRARSQFMSSNPVLAALDSKQDGEISAIEIANSSLTLKTLDQNGDGYLTPNELISTQEEAQATMIMVGLDANSDGNISPAELKDENASLQDMIHSADRNRDGIVSKKELTRELRLRAERKREFDRARRLADIP